jgi:cytochrome c oxidase subunit II
MINRFLGIPENISVHGARVDLFLEVCHWFIGVLLVGWTIYMVYVLLRFRQSQNPKADYVGVTSHTSTYIEVGVVVFEAALLLGFAFPIWADRVVAKPDETKATQVHVIAQQFKWNFHYPGADGKFGKTDARKVSDDNLIGLDSEDPNAKDDVVLLDEMHMPVNKPVVIELTSKDVIHSFAVKTMRSTQDAIPGQRIPVWFTPNRTTKDVQQAMTQEFAVERLPLGWLPAQDYNGSDGQPILSKGTPIRADDAAKLKLAGIGKIVAAPTHATEITCAQLCGNGHAKMRGFVIVETQEEFDKWYAEQPKFAP